MAHLTDSGTTKYSREKLDSMEYSCSTFMLYLGLDHLYDIPHHNVFFAEQYRKTSTISFTMAVCPTIFPFTCRMPR
jgi:phytoene desaturase